MSQKMFVRCHCKDCNKRYKEGLVLRSVMKVWGYVWGEPLRCRQGILVSAYIPHPKFAKGRSKKTRKEMFPTE